MNHQNICNTCKEMSYNCTCDETCYECENCGCISFVQKGPCKECKLSSPVRKVVNRSFSPCDPKTEEEKMELLKMYRKITLDEDSKTEKNYVQDEILKPTLP